MFFFLFKMLILLNMCFINVFLYIKKIPIYLFNNNGNGEDVYTILPLLLLLLLL